VPAATEDRETRSAAGREARTGARLGRLAALCVGVDLAVVVTALALGLPGGPETAPQAAAPPPLALFADLRFVLVYERSWPGFALLAAGVLLARSALTALQARLAWPPLPPPRFGLLFGRSLLFHLLAAALLGPSALLLYAMAAFPISWLFFAALPIAVALVAVLHGGGLAASWWRAPPRLGAAGWALGLIGVLTLVAGGAAVSPVLAVVGAVVAGVLEAAVWARLAALLASPRRRRLHLPLVPPATVLAAALLAVVVLGSAVGFAVARHGAIHPSAAAEAAAGRPGPPAGRPAVLLVEGYASTWQGVAPQRLPVPVGETVVQFSYAGLDPVGRPLPYRAVATSAPLAQLERLLARQVRHLYALSRRKVSIVAVSEGSVLVEDYLARVRRPPLSEVVLISPLLDPGRVSYPAPGAPGWGTAAAAGMSTLASWLAPVAAGVDLSPEQPFLRSLIAERGRLAGGADCAHRCPGVRVTAVVPIADTVAGASLPAGVASVLVPDFHGGDLGDVRVDSIVEAALAGRAVRADGTELALGKVIADLASAWRVPTLPPAAQ